MLTGKNAKYNFDLYILYLYNKEKTSFFVRPSVNIFYFRYFSKIIIVDVKVIIEIGLNNYKELATFAPGVAREFYLIKSRIVLFYCVKVFKKNIELAD